MKTKFDRTVELLKLGLLVIIVILLSLNYYGGDLESKYEVYGEGRFRMNKETGEVWKFESKRLNMSNEYEDSYTKIKIKE